eukprot:scaffold60127_cov55-Attheya_sp.AAC.1
MGSGTNPMEVFNNNGLRSKGVPTLALNLELDMASSAIILLQPVLLLKSCIGNRNHGYDLLPPNSPPFEYTDDKQTTWHYAGYKESPQKWIKRTDPNPIGWYAGKQ